MSVRRTIWLAGGCASLGAAVAGVLLPLVPTTPFLLLAAFAFARSSDRLHDWLVGHPRLGRPIQDWRAHGAVSRRAKLLSALAMAATIALSIAVGVAGWIVVAQTIVMAMVAAFILTRPPPPPVHPK